MARLPGFHGFERMESDDIWVTARVPVIRRIAMTFLEQVVEVNPIYGSVGLPLEALVAP